MLEKGGSPMRKKLAALYDREKLDSLAKKFEEIAEATDSVAIPPGRYLCRVLNGELHESRSGTSGFRVTFVVDDGEHRGVRLYLDSWLTDRALPLAKRDLRKFGITRLEQLEEPFPLGFVAEVTVVRYQDDEGIDRNRIRSFTVVDRVADPMADEDFPPAKS